MLAKLKHIAKIKYMTCSLKVRLRAIIAKIRENICTYGSSLLNCLNIWVAKQTRYQLDINFACALNLIYKYLYKKKTFMMLR